MVLFSTLWFDYIWLMLMALLLFLFFGYFLFMYLCLGLEVTSVFNYKVFSSAGFDFSLSVSLDFKSLVFSSVVCCITFCVILFSNYYMSPFQTPNTFMSLLVLFVGSMLVLINTSDLFMLMLGWDGLGVVSFFLILYYQNSASMFSGLLTFLVNRLGDSMMILAITYMCYTSPFLYEFSLSPSSGILPLIIVLGACTKSAIFPFSPWLPAAMSAPTPISALVHSSTLVTAGLYLMMRFSPMLLHSPLARSMVVMSVFTSFYGGLGALAESDLKKLVALSTLSHLGFIGLALFSGAPNLAFLHLVSHALFKSLLFMSVGEMILLTGHSQDSRVITSSLTYSKIPGMFLNFSIFSLLGLPFVSGFYSKDLILEMFTYSGGSLLICTLVLLNVFLTFVYTLKILQVSYSYSNSGPFKLSANRGVQGSILMAVLGLMSMSVVSSMLWLSPLSSIFLVCPLMKYMPLFIMILSLISTPIKLSISAFKIFGSMLYLTPVFTSLFPVGFLGASSGLFKSYEVGFIDSTSNFHLESLTGILASLISFTFSRVSFSGFILCFLFASVSLLIVL